MDRFRQWVTKLSRVPRYGSTSRYAHAGTLCVSPNAQDAGGPESPMNAIQSCREAINVLNKQELSLQSQVHIAETEARALLRLGDRGGAETSLKKREIVLREIDRLHKTRMSLLSQILLVETASTRQVAVEALASGVAAHRKISHRIFEDTQLERLQDALIEQASFETEISELLGQGFDAIANFDDETMVNLKKSLNELENDEVANALAEASYAGVCSAESYEGTLMPTTNLVRNNPTAISYPVDYGTTSREPSTLQEREQVVEALATEMTGRVGGAAVGPMDVETPVNCNGSMEGHGLSSTLATTMSSPVPQKEGLELLKWNNGDSKVMCTNA